MTTETITGRTHYKSSQRKPCSQASSLPDVMRRIVVLCLHNVKVTFDLTVRFPFVVNVFLRRNNSCGQRFINIF